MSFQCWATMVLARRLTGVDGRFDVDFSLVSRRPIQPASNADTGLVLKLRNPNYRYMTHAVHPWPVPPNLARPSTRMCSLKPLHANPLRGARQMPLAFPAYLAGASGIVCCCLRPPASDISIPQPQACKGGVWTTRDIHVADRSCLPSDRMLELCSPRNVSAAPGPDHARRDMAMCAAQPIWLRRSRHLRRYREQTKFVSVDPPRAERVLASNRQLVHAEGYPCPVRMAIHRVSFGSPKSSDYFTGDMRSNDFL